MRTLEYEKILVDFVVKHHLGIGATLITTGIFYILFGVFGRYPWNYFKGWNADYWIVAWQKTLVQVMAWSAPLFYAFIVVGGLFVYVEYLRRHTKLISNS